jgi:dTDP-4-dehydrorhamnose 3,5-epimerase
MQFEEFKLAGLLLITPQKFGDERGYFSEVFRDDKFTQHAGDIHFIQENQSLSVKVGTIRGLHFQTDPFAQGKLVRCISGAIFDVAVDLRHGSPTYGQWAAVELSAELGNQLWVPAGFAHGFCTLQPSSIVAYKVNAYYSGAHDMGMAWDDSDITIHWPEIADAETLSAKDRVQPKLTELPAYFTMGV